MRLTLALGCALLGTGAHAALAQSSRSAAPAPASVVTHDNLEPAGTLSGKILKVRLEAVRATWRPEGTEGPVRDILRRPSHEYTRSLLAAVPGMRCDPPQPVQAASGPGDPR